MAAVRAVGQWWAFVVRGAVAILFGLLALAMPGMALLSLVLLFGAFALVEGAVNVAGVARRGVGLRHPRWVLVLEGLVSIFAGLFAFFLPVVTALSLVLLVAVWSIATGVLEIAAAVALREHVKGEWLLGLGGVLSVLFGLLLAAFPRAGAFVVVLWIGAYALVFGATLVALGVRLRNVERRSGRGFGELAPGAAR